ncbi:hypothetical protein [Ureibacillus sinduriensis]
MSAVDTLFFAFRACVLDEFLLDFILASIASEMRALEDEDLRSDGDTFFCRKVVSENISINLRLGKRCIITRPNSAGKKITDLWLDDDTFIR